jgi:hypothetical protein
MAAALPFDKETGWMPERTHWMFLVILMSCGGGSEVVTPTERPSESAGEASREALVEGDLSRAANLADTALRRDTSDATARQVAARVALARGEHERVLELLRRATAPELVRLRARANAARGDFEAVARDLESVDGQEPPDGWAEAMLPLARLAKVLRCHQAGGATRATLPFVGRTPIPLVEIAVDGRAVNALIATQADLTIVDDDLRSDAGIVGRLDLGPLAMRNVPALVRDLEPIGAQLGESVGAVLGLDVLLHLGVTIDFRERWVVVRSEGSEANEGAAEAPFLTLGGSFLALEGRLDDRRDALLAFDTAGPFPVAVSDAVAEDLGHDLDALPAAEGAPSESIRMLTLAKLAMGSAVIEGVPAATGLIPADLSELAGAPIGGIVGAIALQQMRVTIDAENRRLLFD